MLKEYYLWSEYLPLWWNWYTRQVEGLCSKGRAGSSPVRGTTNTVWQKGFLEDREGEILEIGKKYMGDVIVAQDGTRIEF